MPRLVIEQPGVPSTTVDFAKPEVRFGRAEDNDCVLVADEVSRYHARFRLHNGETILEDLKSLNGTYVNRQRIVERILSDKDEVWMGSKCRAVFHDDPPEVKEQRKRKGDSKLAQDLKVIGEEMENLSANLTMIGKRKGDSTVAIPTPVEVDGLEVEKMGRAFRRLDALYKASKLMASDFDLDRRMSDLLDLAIDVMGAQRGFLILRKEGTEELGAGVAREMGQDLSAGSPSMGIARKAAIEGEPVLMADSGSDSKYGTRESIIRLQILSAMCVPLRIEDRILGALYVDSKKPTVRFNEEDLELFQAFANQCGMAIENVRLYERMVEAEKKRASLGRFLSPGVVEVVMSSNEDLVLGGQIKMVTTLFCDIRSFTPMAEKLAPVELVDLLNEHFTAMTDIVFKNKGTLDKFVGDEVMALFGAPFSNENDAELAIRAAVAMQETNARLNEARVAKGIPPLNLGIGINTGMVVAGLVGSLERMDFTVLGDHVNIASRLCSVAKAGEVLIGESTYEAAKDMVDAESIGTPILKGKASGVQTYRVRGLKSSVPAGA